MSKPTHWNGSRLLAHAFSKKLKCLIIMNGGVYIMKLEINILRDAPWLQEGFTTTIYYDQLILYFDNDIPLSFWCFISLLFVQVTKYKLGGETHEHTQNIWMQWPNNKESCETVILRFKHWLSRRLIRLRRYTLTPFTNDYKTKIPMSMQNWVFLYSTTRFVSQVIFAFLELALEEKPHTAVFPCVSVLLNICLISVNIRMRLSSWKGSVLKQKL
jgi:hypothetical protein